jgi:hypothetical protein
MRISETGFAQWSLCEPCGSGGITPALSAPHEDSDADFAEWAFAR